MRKNITIDAAIQEIIRELEVRKKVYPRLIQSGKLHRDKANKQYLRLEKALELLQNLYFENTEKNQGTLFDE